MGTRIKSRGAGRRGNYTTDTDVDPEAVYQAIAGYRPRLYPNEIREAVRRLTRAGMGVMVIADHLGVCDRTVSRHLIALKEEEDE